MENMELFNVFRNVPENAKKKITGGRLGGMTDINPMWRIQALTEQFGPCGIGWKYNITKKWLEAGANNEVAAFVDIDLFYKVNGEWSEAVPGTGGSSFIAKERNGLYTSDECFKMALTDALSVACKALGIGADVYWAAGRTKYSGSQQAQEPPKPAQAPICRDCGKPIVAWKDWSVGKIVDKTTKEYGVPVCVDCWKRRRSAERQAGR